jgi:DNA mismatch repair protein MutL
MLVRDDGCGILAEQVELAFERYATSKLHQADDLWSIGTLGFRGEALPSIASVAQVTCITRTEADEAGIEVRIAGGELQARTPRGASPGTSIRVRNLFYNTPVRREYLRSESTEMSAISTVVQQYALAYPEIHFTLLLDGRLALQTSGNGNLRDVLIELYGLDVARQMLPVEIAHGDERDAISISGMISPPGLSRSSRSYMHIFINRRAIYPRGVLSVVVQEAYHTLLMKGRYPIAVLDIRLQPGMVDVNVHPTKSEVRFRHQSRVTGVLGRGIREALLEGADVQAWGEQQPAPGEGAQRRFEVRPQSTPAQRQPEPPGWSVGTSAWRVEHSRWDVGGGIEANRTPPEPAPSPAPAAMPAPAPDTEPDLSPAQPDAAEPAPSPDAADAPPAPDPTPPKLPPLRIVGQVGLTYIVAESPGGMYLVDQHAAHERITYERLMAQRGSGAIDAQELLMPQTVALPPAAAEALLGSSEQLAGWGFALDTWGDGVRVRAIPATLELEKLQEALLEIAGHLTEQSGSTPDDWREAMLVTLSCHYSVRAGQNLSLEEMRYLLRQLEGCQNPHTCPHGRPTMVLLTPGQLEKQFGRKV